MPEILILCEYATLNGGEQSMLATLAGISEAGFRPVVMSPDHGPLAAELASRAVERTTFHCRSADGTRIPQDRLRKELAEILCHRRPALLHANSLAMGRLSGPVAAHCRLPSIAHLRDIVGLSAQAVADLNCHSRLLAVSEATRVFHLAQGVGAGKTYVLHNGVDLRLFHPRPKTGYLHRELGLPPQTQLVGNIGQIGLRKGQDILLHAASLLTDRFPEVRYLIVGERNSDKDESRQFEAALSKAAGGLLSGRVHFLGRRNDIPDLLGELTLLVHTARQEPLGRVLLEAAATGIPIIATDVGGTQEIFPPEAEAAQLVPPDDSSTLAPAIRRLLEDKELRTRIAVAACREAQLRFAIQQSVANLVRCYHALLPQTTF